MHRRRKNNSNKQSVSHSHLAHIVDRLCTRIDDQSLTLAARIDEIHRRIILLNSSLAEITSLLKKPAFLKAEHENNISENNSVRVAEADVIQIGGIG